MRAVLIALALAASSATAFAQEAQPEPNTVTEPEVDAMSWNRADRFLISGDECGASQYQHLVGRPIAELENVSLPADTDLQGGNTLRTLEYRPARLNVVARGGAIVSIACH